MIHAPIFFFFSKFWYFGAKNEGKIVNLPCDKKKGKGVPYGFFNLFHINDLCIFINDLTGSNPINLTGSDPINDLRCNGEPKGSFHK